MILIAAMDFYSATSCTASLFSHVDLAQNLLLCLTAKLEQHLCGCEHVKDLNPNLVTQSPPTPLFLYKLQKTAPDFKTSAKLS